MLMCRNFLLYGTYNFISKKFAPSFKTFLDISNKLNPEGMK